MSLDKQIYEALTGNNLSVEEKKALLNMLKSVTNGGSIIGFCLSRRMTSKRNFMQQD